MYKEVRITRVTPVGVKRVYDLSVEDCHQFVANNLLHHNSAEPNLQQVPKTSVDPNIKKQLIAKPGTLYFVMDFSQAELRIMAHLSGDETYLKAFREGQDPHLAIAAKKYGVSYEEAKIALDNEEHADHKLWKTRRKQAKQIAFGIIYGIQAKLLSQKLSDPKAGLIVTPQEAQRSLDEFFEEHPKIKSFMRKQEKLLRKQGYIKSLFGTKRRLPQIYSEDNAEAAYAVRLAVNFPCFKPSTQVLSKEKGWVNYSGLEVGDLILAFNPETGLSEWQPVLEIHTPFYEGDMYKFSSKHCGISSTSYHRWVLSKHNDLREGDFKVMTSQEMYEGKGNYRIPIRAPHREEIEKTYSNTFVGLCGWYLTDASLRGGQVKIIQSLKANPKKVKCIDTLLSNSGLEYTRVIIDKPTGKVVNWRLSKGSSQKFTSILPHRKLNMRFINSLTNSQLGILLENMRLGDGWGIFASGDKEQASLVQALVVLMGKSSSMFQLSYKGKRSYFKGGKPSPYGQKYIEATKDSWGIKFSNRTMVHTKSYGRKLIEKVPYRGLVWCPSVPSGAIFVRYQSEDDGRYRTLISGNCQCAASHMTLFGSILNYWRMKQGKFPPMEEVATVHDAVYFNAQPKDININTIYEMWNTFRNPETKRYFGFQIDDVDMSMDFEIGRTMAEELPFIPGYDYRKLLEPDFDVEAYMKEYKQYQGQDIKDYPKLFPQYFKKDERRKNKRSI